MTRSLRPQGIPGLLATSLVWGVLVVACDVVAADDFAYFRVPTSELTIVEQVDAPDRPVSGFVFGGPTLPRRVVLDGPGEAFLFGLNSFVNEPADGARPVDGVLYVRAPQGADVRGTIFGDRGAGSRLTFRLPAAAADPQHRADVLRAKAEHYRRLTDARLPGSAWFRHVRRATQLKLDAPTTDSTGPNRPAPRDRLRIFDPEFDDAYALFSGGRALSENLQLDRELLLGRADDAPVAVDKIDGITIKEIDWKPLLAGKSPKIDPPAGRIPADQHAVFFPSFAALSTLSDELARRGTLLFSAAETRSEDLALADRYQRQLGLKMTALGRLLGPQVIRSAALTGGDPYFRVGTDVAVVFEAVDVPTLHAAIVAQVAMNTASESGVETTSGEVDGLAYSARRSADRSVSSYVAVVGDAVVVTNSPAQLRRLQSVAQGKTPALAGLDEYRFFRDRYALGSDDESALLFLSDATIRRWCGPRWRLLDARRTRDAAVLAELQAGHQSELATNKIAEPRAVASDLPTFHGGEFTVSAAGVRSSTLGSLEFMTPIGELSLDTVTKAEADAYGRWRDGYQRNFNWAFDPIALRLDVDQRRITADLTVMPLIAQSEYAEFIGVSRGVALGPTSGDPHETLAHFVLAINKDSERMKQIGSFSAIFAPQLRVDPLSWLGESIALYADPAPLWDDAAQALALRGGEKSDQKLFEEVLAKHGFRVPVALRIETSSTLKATAFVAALRAFIDQTAPGNLVWEPQDHAGFAYVKVSPSPRIVAPGSNESKFALFYALTSDALTISADDALIRRVLDRHAARAKAAEEKVAAASAASHGSPWPGDSMALDLRATALQAFGRSFNDDYRRQMQQTSWNNLPVLNEWRRLYPKEDPVRLHRRLWGATPTCPAGGEYVWNERWQTMESTVVGHSDEPRPGPAAPPQIAEFERFRFGLTFEPQGLRARALLDRKSESKE